MSRLHVLLGKPGYPVTMLEMRNAFAELLIEHYEARVRVGDGIMLGKDLDSAMLFVVTRNVEVGRDCFRAGLTRVNFVAVAGAVHYFDS